jgi:xanthine dehydrogenase small subunit
MEFIPNNLPASLGTSPGEVLADTLRNGLGLRGTTVACREGDCGACTLLIGAPEASGKLRYKAITSCISPSGNAAGCHVLSIEGLSQHGKNPLQELLARFSGTQCGFCTPGFVVSLTGFLLNSPTLSLEDAIAAIDGNICRCTGYKAIERALGELIATYAKDLLQTTSREEALIAAGFLPPSFAQAPKKVALLQKKIHAEKNGIIVGGGSDLFVQKPEVLRSSALHLSQHRDELKGITIDGNQVQIGAATSIKEFCEHPQLLAALPCLPSFARLFASSQIRAQASVGGNIVNASPIGDLSNFLLALDAQLQLEGPDGQRTIAHTSFYRGYKQLDLLPIEYLRSISFALPDADWRVNFEKVSRRTHLDIASVNSTIAIRLVKRSVVAIRISAGGVGPSPLRLTLLEQWLYNKTVNNKNVREAAERAMQEVTTISDVRGSAAYKRKLLGNLIIAHFLACYPEYLSVEALLP